MLGVGLQGRRGSAQSTGSLEGAPFGNFENVSTAIVGRLTDSSISQEKFQEYATKNLALSISPPSDNGQRITVPMFRFKLKLGSKVSLASFDSLEIRISGQCVVYGEPPITHRSAYSKVSILPLLDDDVTTSAGKREFSGTIKLGQQTNCACEKILPLPSSCSHSAFKVSYSIELISRKKARFSWGGNERLQVPFLFEASRPAPPLRLMGGLGVGSSLSGTGMDGEWRTSTVEKIITIENQAGSVFATAAAVLLPPTIEKTKSRSILRIPYRLDLSFLYSCRPHDIDLAAFTRLRDGYTVTLSRRLVISSPDKPKDKTFSSPSLVVTSQDIKERLRIVEVDGCAVVRFEGRLEIDSREALMMKICNVEIQYSLAIRAPLSTGISSPIEIIVRPLDLSFPTPITNLSPSSSISASTRPLAPASPSSTLSSSTGALRSPIQLRRNSSIASSLAIYGAGNDDQPPAFQEIV